MGSAASKPAAPTTSTVPVSEKGVATTAPASRQSTVSWSSHSGHHAADRLARIEAESRHRSGRFGGAGARCAAASTSSRAESGVTLDALHEWDDRALENPTARLAALTLHNTDISTALHSRDAEVTDQHVFSQMVSLEGTPVTNQKRSGRCWLFATTNVIRTEVMRKLNVENFQLSQSYLSFYDKLEKSNFYLESMIDLADLPLDDRTVGFLKTAPADDGGQWDMVVNLLNKYGIVPQPMYPESYNSSNSNNINWLVTLKLREFTLELREIRKRALENLASSEWLSQKQKEEVALKAVRQRKDEQMAEVYRIMVISLGAPPKPDREFTWSYRDKDNKFHSIKTTPRNFLRDYTGTFDPNKACSLVNDPRFDLDKLYTVDRLGNVIGGQPVLYVNTSVEQMKDSVIKTIKAGLPVFFGCDVLQFADRTGGIMDTALFNYELAYDVKLGLSKAERLELGESSMTHAMVITGVHLEDGKPIRYRVENSWSDAVGDKGYMVMSDKWFDEFVYQVVIRKEYMPAKLWNIFERGVDEQTVHYPPWDPMGSLA